MSKYEKLQSRQNYQRVWQLPLTQTVSRPGFCCFAMFCSYCASYSLRKQALYGDMSRYICCNGTCPCSGRCGEQKNPELCLCMEVTCCFAQSVASTRWMIQDELGIQNTQCDNCIIGTMIAMQYFACICSIAACLTGSDEINDLAQLLDCVADILWCTVCACLQTQHKEELDIRDNRGGQAGAGGYGGPGQAPAVQMIPTGYQQHPQAAYPQPGYPVQQGGYPGQHPGYPGQHPGYPGQHPGYPGQHPGYPGQPAGYPPQPAERSLLAPQQQMYR